MSDEEVLQKCEHCLDVTIHKGVPSNGVHTVAGVACYVAGGSSGSTAIVICTDIFGQVLPNVRLLADKLAAKTGFTVYVPDILHGDAISPDAFDRSTFMEWRSRHGDGPTLPVVEAVLAELLSKRGVTRVGIIGYCFGGRYAALAAKAGLVHAYAVAHPSFVSVEDFTCLASLPALFLCAETDAQFPAHVADEVEAALKGAGAAGVEFRRYPGTTHGFAVRGSEEDAVVLVARDDALDGAATFFAKYLA